MVAAEQISDRPMQNATMTRPQSTRRGTWSALAGATAKTIAALPVQMFGREPRAPTQRIWLRCQLPFRGVVPLDDINRPRSRICTSVTRRRDADRPRVGCDAAPRRRTSEHDMGTRSPDKVPRLSRRARVLLTAGVGLLVLTLVAGRLVDTYVDLVVVR